MRKLDIIITQIGHPNFRGGGNTVVHNVSELLSKRGHTVTVIFLFPKKLFLDKPKTTYGVIMKKDSLIPIVNCIKIANIIRKLFKKREPDVIISFGYEGFFIPYIKDKSIFIAASHNFLSQIGVRNFLRLRWLNPFNLGRLLYLTSVFIDKSTKGKADFVQCPSRFAARQCETIYRIPKNKIFVVHNGIDLSRFTIRPQPKEKTILFVGGTSQHKGLDILIHALPLILEKHPDAKLIIVGEMKKEEKELINIADELGVSERISWIGLVSQERIFEFYKKAYLAVFPSRLESFLLAALEAMACGIPIIVTDVGIMPEIINDKSNGLLMEQEDFKGLAEKIIYLLNNPEKAKKMGLMGRASIEQKFTWSEIIRKFEKEILTRLR